MRYAITEIFQIVNLSSYISNHIP